MRQKNYLFDTMGQAIDGITDIAEYVGSHPHADVLLTLYCSGIESDEMTRFLAELDESLPDAKRAGISDYPYGSAVDAEPGSKDIQVNVMLSDSAHFHVLQIPCTSSEERKAAERFREAVADIPNVKGIALYPSCPMLDVTKFLRLASTGLPGIPFFGAMAADQLDPFDHRIVGESYGIGERLICKGFTAVIFSGPDLDVLVDYVLGWHPVGRVMDPTIGNAPDKGESCVVLLDGEPAIEIYDKYLGVIWDDNFISNVCEFPLLVRRNGIDICMIPTEAGESGELHFSGCVMPDDKIRFSYGTHEGVLGAARAGRERMRAFGAQAMLMSLCGNRAIFLGDDAHIEWDLYRETCPELAFCHGSYEIAWRVSESDGTERGGVLNSALVAIGFREGSRDAAVAAGEPAEWSCCITKPEARHDEGPIPLPYRLARFFDVMTGELVHLQRNLEQEVEKKTHENESLALHVVITLAAAIDAKDAYTNGHSGRVATYAREIARRAGYSEKRQNEIYVMGILHDVGKIGVPDDIITKPGRLTDEEFAAIKEHPAIGARILSAIEEMPGLATGAHWHHERYDGKGYPDGLAGEDIPEEARIIAVADAYDAMTSNRSYRDAMPQERVREQVEGGRGTQFDPRFADIMLSMIDDDCEYALREHRQ